MLVNYIDEKGRRVSTESAYLSREVRRRKNLTILTNVRVTKLKLEFTGMLHQFGIGRETLVAIRVRIVWRTVNPSIAASARRALEACWVTAIFDEPG